MITNEQLKNRVRQLLNETGDDSDVTLLTEDTRSLDTHIDSLLPEAVLYVQMNKGLGSINPKQLIVVDSDICDNGDCSGSFVLPDDFVRIVVIDMNGWQRACTVLYPEDSPVGMMQMNPYSRAGYCKPICVERHSDDGRRLLCYYSLPSGVKPKVKRFVYEAAYDAANGLSGIEEFLHNAVIYRCAALLYNVFGRFDYANALSAMAASYCLNLEQNKNQ